MSESQSPSGFDVGSTLRDRIARVLFDLNAGDDWNGDPLVWDDNEIAESFRDCFRRQADAVIEALSIKPQSEVYKYGPIMPDGFQQALLRHRYVTEWAADE